MILYCAATEQSVIKLFAAGVIPGVVLAFIMALYIYVYARWKGIDTGTRFRWSVFATALREGVWAIMMPVIVFGGIYGGVFSPTEAAGRRLRLRHLRHHGDPSRDRLARVLGRISELDVSDRGDLPDRSGRRRVLLAADDERRRQGACRLHQQPEPVALDGTAGDQCFPVIVGCFIDNASAILVLTPLLLPIAQAIGVDPIHFGIIVVTNLSIGTFTPPFGSTSSWRSRSSTCR